MMKKYRLLSIMLIIAMIFTSICPVNIFAEEIEIFDEYDEYYDDNDETDPFDSQDLEEPDSGDKQIVTNESAGLSEEDEGNDNAEDGYKDEQPANDIQPAFFQFAVGNADVTVTADPGAFSSEATLSVNAAESEELYQSVEKALGISADEGTIIRHQAFSFDGTGFNGTAQVTIDHLGFSEFSSQYEDGALSVRTVYWDENSEATLISSDVNLSSDQVSFSIGAFGSYDIVSVIELPIATNEPDEIDEQPGAPEAVVDQTDAIDEQPGTPEAVVDQTDVIDEQPGTPEAVVDQTDVIDEQPGAPEAVVDQTDVIDEQPGAPEAVVDQTDVIDEQPGTPEAVVDQTDVIDEQPDAPEAVVDQTDVIDEQPGAPEAVVDQTDVIDEQPGAPEAVVDQTDVIDEQPNVPDAAVEQYAVIASQPENAYAAEGDEVSFAVLVNLQDVEYQWQRSKDDEEWQDINEDSQLFTGAQTSVLSFVAGANTISRKYRCVIKSGDEILDTSDSVGILEKADEKITEANTANSDNTSDIVEEEIGNVLSDAPATADSSSEDKTELNDLAQNDDFFFTSTPQSVYALEGDEITFTAQTNREEAQYQWQRCKDGVNWQEIKEQSQTYHGAQTTTLTFTASSSSMAQYYRCAVTLGEEVLNTEAVQVLLGTAEEDTTTDNEVQAAVVEELPDEEIAGEQEAVAQQTDVEAVIPEENEIAEQPSEEVILPEIEKPLLDGASGSFISGVYFWDGLIEKENCNIYFVTNPNAQFVRMYGSGQSATWSLDEAQLIDSNAYNKTVKVEYYFEESGEYNLKFQSSVDGENWSDEFAAETQFVTRPPIIDWWYGASVENKFVEISIDTNLDMTSVQIYFGSNPIAVWTEGQEGIDIVTGSSYKCWHGFITLEDFAEGEYPFKNSGTYLLWYKAADSNNNVSHGYDTNNRPTMSNLEVKRPDIINVEYYERVFENEPAHIYVTTNLEMECIHMYLGDNQVALFTAENCEGIETALTCKIWDVRYTFTDPGKYYAWYKGSKDGTNTGLAFSSSEVFANVERHDIISLNQPETGIVNEPVTIQVTTNLDANYLYIMEGEQQIGTWEFNAENENMDLWTSCKDWYVDVTFDTPGTHSLWYRVSADGTTIRNAYPDTPIDIEDTTTEETFELEDVVYAITGETTLRVVRYNGTSSSVVIPETIESRTVTEIGESAFEGNETITSVDLPDTIQIIRRKAFKNCTNLVDMH